MLNKKIFIPLIIVVVLGVLLIVVVLTDNKLQTNTVNSDSAYVEQYQKN